MKQKILLFLLTCFVGLCAYLFIVFYGEAEKTAIRQLNEEQQIHAKQAAHGIEDFFATWTGILSSFSKMDAIIGDDADGKRYMTLFYEAHHEQIRSITRVDERGRILHTVPFSSSIGSDISDQKHMQAILRNHVPVVSDVFRTVQGFSAIALHMPVFKGKTFKGTIAVVVDFENLAKRYLEVIKIGKTGYAWVVSRDGTTLYSPVPGFTGRPVFDTAKDFPSVLPMVKEMLQGREGIATYTFDKIGDRTVAPVKKYAVYMPIRIADSFWSIVVASTEEEVLASFASFRNRLILVIIMILLGGIVFSVISAKAWLIFAEEKKRRKAEEDLRARETQLSLIYDGVYDIVFVVRVEPDDVFRFISVNRRFLEATGLQEHQIVGKEINEVIPEQSAALVLQKYKEAVQKNRSVQWEEVTVYPAGEKTAEVAISPVFDAQGVCTQLIGMAHDITERKRAEAALRLAHDELEQKVAERTRELSEANARLQELDRLKSMFIASMSHELRTPLNSIIGFTGILLQGLAGDLTGEQRKQLGMVKGSSEHLLALITDIIDLSKIEARKIDLTLEPFDLSKVVNEVLESFQVAAARKALLLSADIPPGVMLVSDKRRIRQVLVNLVGNAVKFTDKGSVRVSAQPDGDFIKVSVVDTGLGIKHEDQDKLIQVVQPGHHRGRAQDMKAPALGCIFPGG